MRGTFDIFRKTSLFLKGFKMLFTWSSSKQPRTRLCLDHQVNNTQQPDSVWWGTNRKLHYFDKYLCVVIKKLGCMEWHCQLDTSSSGHLLSFPMQCLLHLDGTWQSLHDEEWLSYMWPHSFCSVSPQACMLFWVAANSLPTTRFDACHTVKTRVWNT